MKDKVHQSLLQLQEEVREIPSLDLNMNYKLVEHLKVHRAMEQLMLIEEMQSKLNEHHWWKIRFSPKEDLKDKAHQLPTHLLEKLKRMLNLDLNMNYKLVERLKVHQAMEQIMPIEDLQLKQKEHLLSKIKFFPKEDLKDKVPQ